MPKKSSFDIYDDIQYEIETINKKISKLSRLKNFGDKYVKLHDQRDRLNKKKEKYYKEKIKWSDESRESFAKFNINFIDDDDNGRVFKFKNKYLKVHAWCTRFEHHSHSVFDKFSTVVKKLENGDEIWKCGKCADFHNRGDDIFEFDSVPTKEVKSFYIFKKTQKDTLIKKVKSMRKKTDFLRIELEEYHPNFFEKFKL